MDSRLIGIGGQIVGGFLLGQQQREQRMQDAEVKQKQIDQMLKFAQAREKREERLFEKQMGEKESAAPLMQAVLSKYGIGVQPAPAGDSGTGLKYGETFGKDSSAAEASATPQGPDIAGLMSDPLALALLKHGTGVDWLGAGNAARQNQEFQLNLYKAQREGTQGSWVDIPDGAGGVAKVWQPKFGGPSVGGGVGGYQPPKPELRQFEQGGVTYEQPVNPYTQQPLSGANVKTEKKPMPADSAGKMGMLKSGLDAIRQVNSMLMPNGNADSQTYKVLAQMEANLPWTTGRQVGSLMDDALEGKIRIESGAAVPDQEIKRMAKRFKPSVADQPELIKQKLSRMEQYLTGTIEMLDPNKNYSKTAEVFTAQDGKKYVMQPNSKLSQDKAMEYLKRAGGDKGKARELAKRDGWEF